jgi:hypothetical protein
MLVSFHLVLVLRRTLEQVSNYFVRERKKAGYVIKARHGLHARRRRLAGAAASKSESLTSGHPEVVVTQHPPAAEEEMVDMEDAEMELDTSGNSSLVHAAGGAGPAPSVAPSATSVNGQDDLPELSYDDTSSLHHRKQGYTGYSTMPLTIPSSHAMDRATTNLSVSSGISTSMSMMTDDDGSELASPPFEATVLPEGKVGEEGKMLLNAMPLEKPKGMEGIYSHGPLAGIA